MKKTLALLLTMAMLLACLPLQVLAADNSAAPTLTIAAPYAAPGQEIEVNVNITDNPGIYGTILTFTFPSDLTLLGATKGTAFASLDVSLPEKLSSPYTIVCDGVDTPATADGTIITFRFKVSDSVKLNSTLPIKATYQPGDVVDANFKDLDLNVVNGAVMVIDYIPGDVNGDGRINTIDVTWIRRYRMGGYELENFNEAAADVNNDGRINTIDVTWIRRYRMGYPGVTLLPSTPRCDHAGLQAVAAKEPTCSVAGNVAHWYCADCHQYFGDAEAKNAIAEADVVLPATDHTEVIDPAVAPTQTSTGLTEGSHCSVCGTVLVAQQVLPKLESTYHAIIYRNLNGAQAPSITQYDEKTGLLDLPTPEAPGYVFKGWFTASQGGEVVDYIPAGSTKDYILFARWDLVTYNIYYYDAPEHSNVSTYTVEDRVLLDDPKWSGLQFIGWTDANGKSYTEIPKGTTGDLELTASWKLMRNVATPSNNDLMLAEYDASREQYIFIYELGTIEHVVLEELSSSTPNLYNHTGAGDFTLSLENSLTMEESIADSITKTISKSVSSSSEWELSKEWAQENSDEHNTSLTIGTEVGTDFVKASVEAGYSYTNTSTSSWGESSSEGGSYGEEVESGEESNSTLSYLESLTTTTSTSITISKDSPEGYYSYVHAGNIRVFGVVVYEPESGNIYLNTYSMLDNMHDMVLYYPDVNSLNHPTCETLQYSIPRDQMFDALQKAYFVEYHAEGGEGEMNKSLHTVGGSEQLQVNTITRPGYVFMGWEERYEDGTTKSTYTDGQIIRDIADKGDVVDLYALWESNAYTVEFEGNKPAYASTHIENLPKNIACQYDEEFTLPDAPILAGYTFGGWYLDADCTRKLGDPGDTMINLTTDVNGVVTLHAQWTANTYTVTFDPNGGTLAGNTVDVVFDQLYGTLLTPTRTNHDFIGWYLEDGTQITATNYMRIPGDHTVIAKWLKTKETIYVRHDTYNPGVADVRITDNDGVYEKFDPQLDRNALLAAGYKKITISFNFQLKEINQGNQDMWFSAWYDYTVKFHHNHYNSTPSGWTSYSGTVTLDLTSDYISDSCHFWIEWGAEGSGGDDWWLGDTTITVYATKK